MWAAASAGAFLILALLVGWRNHAGCPPWLDEEAKRFLSRNITGRIPRLRASELSSTQFEAFVNRGQPIVVEGAAELWPALRRLNCTNLAAHYPGVEYHDWQGGERKPVSSIEYSRSGGWECAAGYMEKGPEWEVNRPAFADWLSGFKAPPFMPAGAFGDTSLETGTGRSVGMSAFLGMPGTGVTPHLDELCASLMTVQLSGTKAWTVSSPQLYQRADGTQGIRWSDPSLVVLRPGDALFWYVSQLHHTEVIEGCSLSVSLQFQHPAPTDYFHNLIESLNSLPEDDRYSIYRQARAHRADYVTSCQIREWGGIQMR